MVALGFDGYHKRRDAEGAVAKKERQTDNTPCTCQGPTPVTRALTGAQGGGPGPAPEMAVSTRGGRPGTAHADAMADDPDGVHGGERPDDAEFNSEDALPGGDSNASVSNYYENLNN